MCMGCFTKGGSSESMQRVWKEGECELNPLCSMWLLGARVMFRNAKKFGECGTAFSVQCVEMEGDRQMMSLALKMVS